jgi:hypothetical protein
VIHLKKRIAGQNRPRLTNPDELKLIRFRRSCRSHAIRLYHLQVIFLLFDCT